MRTVPSSTEHATFVHLAGCAPISLSVAAVTGSDTYHNRYAKLLARPVGALAFAELLRHFLLDALLLVEGLLSRRQQPATTQQGGKFKRQG